MAVGQRRIWIFSSPKTRGIVSPRTDCREPADLDDLGQRSLCRGDCVFGPRLIIDSVADGKRAAMGIDEFLRLHRSREAAAGADSGDGEEKVCRLRVRPEVRPSKVWLAAVTQRLTLMNSCSSRSTPSRSSR